MTVIKNLAFCDKNKLKNLNSFVESELDLSAFYPFPVDFLHNFLPFGLKFLNESFVVIENDKIKGLVTVAKAGRKKIKIKRLLTEENSTEQGKLLINCVINSFLSKGVESFFVIVDKRNHPVLNMFKMGLGFSPLAFETVYKTNVKDLLLGFDDVNFDHIRLKKAVDNKKIANLVNETMYSNMRATFAKEAYDFSIKPFSSLEQFVIFDDSKNSIFAYFSILKLNSSDYLLDFVVKKGYEGYFSDIIKFTKIKLMKKKKFTSLLVRIKSYYSNYSELNEILKIEYQTSFENEILVKDFLIPKKQFSYERMIFNDATPAF